MSIIKLLRVHQWVKNTFLFVPAFFAAEMFDEKSLMLIPAFFAFSLISSAVYVINDYRDIEVDKIKELKKKWLQHCYTQQNLIQDLDSKLFLNS